MGVNFSPGYFQCYTENIEKKRFLLKGFKILIEKHDLKPLETKKTD